MEFKPKSMLQKNMKNKWIFTLRNTHSGRIEVSSPTMTDTILLKFTPYNRSKIIVYVVFFYKKYSYFASTESNLQKKKQTKLSAKSRYFVLNTHWSYKNYILSDHKWCTSIELYKKTIKVIIWWFRVDTICE